MLKELFQEGGLICFVIPVPEGLRGLPGEETGELLHLLHQLYPMMEVAMIIGIPASM